MQKRINTKCGLYCQPAQSWRPVQAKCVGHIVQEQRTLVIDNYGVSTKGTEKKVMMGVRGG